MRGLSEHRPMSIRLSMRMELVTHDRSDVFEPHLRTMHG